MKAKAQRSYLGFRVFLVTAGFLVFFLLILFRVFQLQILDGAELKKMAASQHTRTLTVHSKRGDIYDRNMAELAVSIEVDSVYVQPAGVTSPAETARRLAPLVGMRAADVAGRLRDPRGFVWIKRQVDLKDEAREVIASLDGVGIIKESRRYYPNGELAGHLLGFTGVDSKGLEGLELYYDNVLKGATIKVAGQRDARGRTLLFEDVGGRVPLEGMMVRLTIDRTIQYIAEKALKRGMETSRAKGGTAIVMDPATGEVLAMAVLPAFDPNDFRGSNPGQRRNRAVTDVYEPGSIFKPFVLSAALEEEVVKPGEIIWCELGRYRVADRVLHDTKKHGWLSVPQILKYSSNIGSAKIGERMGGERLYRYLRAYGFGEKTGIDLPGEGAGVLRPYGTWSAVTIDTVSFGQGISATPIQLINALSAVANGGFLMKPYVVKSVEDPEGNVISESHPVVLRRVISESSAARMTGMLTGVTRQGGTGELAAIEGFEVAGKTATAQKPDLARGGYMKDAYIASFFGYVPAREPAVAVLVSLDEPQGAYYGGKAAAPVFREIASQTLSYMGLMPGSTAAGADQLAPSVRRKPGFRIIKASARSESALGGAGPSAYGVPDMSGLSMRMAMKRAAEAGLEVKPVGSGRAVRQSPAPGGRKPPDGAVKVWFR